PEWRSRWPSLRRRDQSRRQGRLGRLYLPSRRMEEDEFALVTSESIRLQIRCVLRTHAATPVGDTSNGDGLWIRRRMVAELVEKGDCPAPASAVILSLSRRGTRSRRSPQRPPRLLRDSSLPGSARPSRPSAPP